MKKKGAKDDKISKLYPFMASTKEMKEAYTVPDGDDLLYLEEVSHYGRELRIAALIPRNLRKALEECGVKKENSKELTKWISKKLQNMRPTN